MFRRHNTRPVVKKVSALVDKRSHKQRKYLSLMLVPSYSSGKTRSLRIPRLVFYCILGIVAAVSTVTAGLWISRQRFAQHYQEASEHLYDAQRSFEEFQYETLQEQLRRYEEALLLEEQLSVAESQARIDQFILQQRQRQALHELQRHIDELEEMIRYLDEQRQALIDGISSRTFIPPVYGMYVMLLESQANLLSQSVLLNPNPINEYEVVAATVGFVGFFDAVDVSVLSEEALHDRLNMLMAEVDLQMVLLEDFQVRRRSMDPHLRNFPTLWPVSSEISSPFGWRRNPFGGGSEFHRGIDIRAPRGTAIRAAGGGTVTFQGWRNGYGNTVVICHGNGYTTLYAHNSANLVYVGQRVERGDIIARVGATGRATGNHVHFEVRLNGVHQNPRHFMLEHWS